MEAMVRSFTTAGVRAMREWLAQPSTPTRLSLLNDEHLSEPIPEDYVVDMGRRFTTSYELGVYLVSEVFKDGPDRRDLLARGGMWSWLSLAFIESLKKKDGGLLNEAHYVDVPKWAYRLITRTAWDLVSMYGESARVALGSKRTPWGEMAEQMTATQEVYANPSFWPVAYRLYVKPDGSVKRGATSQRTKTAKRDPKSTSGLGGVRRLPTTYKQFDRTYNLRVMEPNEVLGLLPAEYHRWLSDGPST